MKLVHHPEYFPRFHTVFWAGLKNLRGKKISVIGHIRPDGDALGSQVALTRVLRALGYDACAVAYSPIPKNLYFLIGDTPIVFNDKNADLRDAAILVDCASLDRVGDLFLSRLPECLLNVDHHISNPGFGKNNIVVTDAAATCEILAGLFIDFDFPIDHATAQALYVGIATDTGQFCYNTTTARVFDLVHRLVKLGAVASAAANELYFNDPLAKRKLLQVFLSRMEIHCGGRFMLSVLHDSDYAETGAAYEDAEGLIDFLRNIEGVEIVAFIDDRTSFAKTSLRSRSSDYDVSKIASEFGGGGHKMAAGYTGKGEWMKIRDDLLAVVKKTLSETDQKASE